MKNMDLFNEVSEMEYKSGEMKDVLELLKTRAKEDENMREALDLVKKAAGEEVPERKMSRGFALTIEQVAKDVDSYATVEYSGSKISDALLNMVVIEDICKSLVLQGKDTDITDKILEITKSASSILSGLLCNGGVCNIIPRD